MKRALCQSQWMPIATYQCIVHFTCCLGGSLCTRAANVCFAEFGLRWLTTTALGRWEGVGTACLGETNLVSAPFTTAITTILDEPDGKGQGWDRVGQVSKGDRVNSGEW
jgi:hypothetical protein